MPSPFFSFSGMVLLLQCASSLPQAQKKVPSNRSILSLSKVIPMKIECDFSEAQAFIERMTDRIANAEAEARAAEARAQVLQEQMDRMASPALGLSNSTLRYQVEKLLQAATTGGKISAIKAVRALLRDDTGLQYGLKEAKDFVEAAWGKPPQW